MSHSLHADHCQVSISPHIYGKLRDRADLLVSSCCNKLKDSGCITVEVCAFWFRHPSKTGSSSAQGKLLGASEVLVSSSDKLQSTMETVIEYEEHTASVLRSWMGSSMTAGDFAFYGASVAAAIACGVFKPLQMARMPLIVLLSVSLAIERTILEKWSSSLTMDSNGKVWFSMLAIKGAPI